MDIVFRLKKDGDFVNFQIFRAPQLYGLANSIQNLLMHNLNCNLHFLLNHPIDDITYTAFINGELPHDILPRLLSGNWALYGYQVLFYKNLSQVIDAKSKVQALRDIYEKHTGQSSSALGPVGAIAEMAGFKIPKRALQGGNLSNAKYKMVESYTAPDASATASPVGGRRRSRKLRMVKKKTVRRLLKKMGLKMRGGDPTDPTAEGADGAKLEAETPEVPASGGKRHRSRRHRHGKKTRSLFGLRY